MAEEIKQGDHKFYVGEDENNPQAVITFKEVITMKSILTILVYLMNRGGQV